MIRSHPFFGRLGKTEVADGEAPDPVSFSVSSDLNGRVLTLSANILPAGTPVAVTAFTVNGQTASLSGSGPWTYTFPDATTPLTAAWSLSATHTELTLTDSGEATVPANAMLPLIAADVVLDNNTITITPQAAGTPTPTISLTALTLDGVSVIGDATGSGPWVYTVPEAAANQTVAWVVSATNPFGSDTDSGTIQIPATLVPPPLPAGEWIIDGDTVEQVPTLGAPVVSGQTVVDTLAQPTGAWLINGQTVQQTPTPPPAPQVSGQTVTG